MRQMVWRGLAAMMVVAGMAAPARADFNIAVGLKWVPLRYTFPVGAGSEVPGPPQNVSNTEPVPGQWYKGTGSALYGNHWQTTSLDNYIAFFFTEQIGLQLSLDLGWGSHNNDAEWANNTRGGLNTSYFQFGLGIGGKFYLNRPTRERISPYILVNFFKYFASISTNDPAIGNDIVSAIAQFYSPIGFDVAFGAEYFFTTSFSLGAEVFGLRFAHVGATYNTNAASFTVGENYFTLYTGISLNYRFLATASVRTYEDEEDRQNPRTRRPPPRRRPVEQPIDEGNPPPSPESVD